MTASVVGLTAPLSRVPASKRAVTTLVGAETGDARADADALARVEGATGRRIHASRAAGARFALHDGLAHVARLTRRTARPFAPAASVRGAVNVPPTPWPSSRVAVGLPKTATARYPGRTSA